MPANPTVLRLLLGAELRDLRKAAGLNLEQTCEALVKRDLDISTSKLSRLETGRGAVKIQDVKALLELYQVADDASREALMKMARDARAAAPAAWWTEYDSVLPSGLSTYVGLEASASRLLAFTGTVIDGLLQTASVAHSLIRAAQPTEPAKAIDALVELRMQRQKVLRAKPPLELVTIMDEAALLRPAGPPEAMKEQWRQIIETCEELPHVQLQIVPLSKGVYNPQHGMFSILESQDISIDPIVYIDSTGGNLYLQRPNQILSFRKIFGNLQAIALDPNESLDLLRRFV